MLGIPSEMRRFPIYHYICTIIKNMHSKVEELNNKFASKSLEEILAYFINSDFPRSVFASSLGLEDQVISHLISKINKEAKIFTLDTGRLFPETYNLIDKTNKKLGVNIECIFPDFHDVEKMVNKKGINLFFESSENRKECCFVRKVTPLKRAFVGFDAWICGLRREQAVTRNQLQLVEWDAGNKLLKVNPLYNWTEDEVWNYIKINEVPYNELNDKGFLSIGCQPCTRALKEGEDNRAGRWWWEKREEKECGLHIKK